MTHESDFHTRHCRHCGLPEWALVEWPGLFDACTGPKRGFITGDWSVEYPAIRDVSADDARMFDAALARSTKIIHYGEMKDAPQRDVFPRRAMIG